MLVIGKERESVMVGADANFLAEALEHLRLYNQAWQWHSRCEEERKRTGARVASRQWMRQARWFEAHEIYDLSDLIFDEETDSFSFSAELMQRKFSGFAV